MPFLLAATLFGNTSCGDDICGAEVFTLYAGQTIEAGTVTVSNTDDTLVVTYATSDGWSLDETHLHVACSLDDVPQTPSGNPKVGKFDHSGTHASGTTSTSYEIPLADIDCFTGCGDDLVIAAHAVVEKDDGTGGTQSETGWGDGDDFPGASWATYIGYEVACCDDDTGDTGDESCGQYRTQTQGGWGTSASGNNPGAYRDANWDACIGSLSLGDEAGYTLSLTSSAAVEAFLPQGGTPSSLTVDEVDPTESSAGVLAGQTTALAMSVAFDTCDADFGDGDDALADLVAQSGDCSGATVSELLDAANCVLSGVGGCAYDASAINGCVDDANNAFVDGSEATGFLCEDGIGAPE